MRNAQQQVQAFMWKAGQHCPRNPTMPSRKVRKLREGLIVEEWVELQCAKTLEEFADAIGDLLYVVIGTAVAAGIEIEPVFNEIHRSNMSKFIDGYRRKDGKWVKGPSYSPARLKPILKKQQTRI